MDDTLQILKDITGVFESGEGLELATSVVDQSRKVRKNFDAQQREARQTIKALSDVILREKRKIEQATQHSESATQERMDALEEEKMELARKIENWENAIDGVSRDQASLAKTETRIKDKQGRMKKETDLELPHIRRVLSLYAVMTKTHWDYESSTVKGNITLDDDTRIFDLDPATHDDVAICNYIWDLIE